MSDSGKNYEDILKALAFSKRGLEPNSPEWTELLEYQANQRRAERLPFDIAKAHSTIQENEEKARAALLEKAKMDALKKFQATGDLPEGYMIINGGEIEKVGK